MVSLCAFHITLKKKKKKKTPDGYFLRPQFDLDFEPPCLCSINSRVGRDDYRLRRQN